MSSSHQDRCTPGRSAPLRHGHSAAGAAYDVSRLAGRRSHRRGSRRGGELRAPLVEHDVLPGVEATEYEVADLCRDTGFRLRHVLDTRRQPVVNGVASLDPDDAVAGAAAAGSAQRR